MIARMWHGRVPAERAEEYHQYLLGTGVTDFGRTPGNRGAYVLCRIEGDVAHFEIISLWESMDAIRAFAGEEPERARYYPEDDDFLLEREPFCRHYEVLTAAE